MKGKGKVEVHIDDRSLADARSRLDANGNEVLNEAIQVGRAVAQEIADLMPGAPPPLIGMVVQALMFVRAMGEYDEMRSAIAGKLIAVAVAFMGEGDWQHSLLAVERGAVFFTKIEAVVNQAANKIGEAKLRTLLSAVRNEQ